MTKLKKAALFTDLHFGRKGNSRIHNNDCINFIEWFCTQCKKHSVDHIFFGGDWFEERTAIDSLTAKFALDSARKLNALGIPIYFIVGNHDLYYRDNREVFATYAYSELTNFHMIDEPTVIDETMRKTLICPYLFEDEYGILTKYFDIPVWIGHFEFKGFVLTGDTVKKKDGPDPTHFSAPDIIMSGHFHKRQGHEQYEAGKSNVVYIGNTFPMDFGDANDYDRGMAIYDYESGALDFINWEDCPKYQKISLSTLKNNPKILEKNARVKCDADIDITYDQHSALKTALVDRFDLREFNINEISNVVIEDGELTEEEISSESTESLVRKLLERVEGKDIDSEKLIKVWDSIA
jgi:DNA repair exonuclease SbcCD nuclease subunit